jgi:hypothetical protein
MARFSYPICLALLAVGGGLAWWSGASAFGFVALASIAGVIATRSVGRRIIAIAVVVGAIGAVAEAGAYPAAAFMVAAAIGIFRYAPGWPSLGNRFERKPSDNPWEQLDRGEDPTLR